MQTPNPSSENKRVDAEQRAQILTAFERSGLSAAAFARQHNLKYTTFCSWRKHPTRRATPKFVQVELSAPSGGELVIELGADVRVRIGADQIGLAVQLLQSLKRRPC